MKTAILEQIDQRARFSGIISESKGNKNKP
jgi:hypothetical protein